MRKLFTILMLSFMTLIFAGCMKNNIYQNPEPIPSPVQELSVEVPENMYAVVLFHEDTLAVLPASATIIAPVSSKGVTTRALDDDEITIEYINMNGNNVILGNGKQHMFQTIAFEDSKNGDYDYNDLIIHTKILKKHNTGKLYLYLHPIALGASKTIGLGCIVTTHKGISNDLILFNDVRQEMFEGREGFINTNEDAPLIKYENTFRVDIPAQKNDFIRSVDWYIIVDGDLKLYAVSDNYRQTDKNNRPYGLVLCNIRSKGYKFNGAKCGYDWWEYPAESNNIDNVYLFSRMFFAGNKFMDYKIFSNQKGGEGFIDAIPFDTGETVDKTCLYAIDFDADVSIIQPK